MGTKCDRCDNEATVHEVSVRHGVKHERHLCETCAATHGLDAAATGAAGTNPNVVHLVKQLMIQGVPGATPGTPVQMGRLPVCQGCRMSFADFKQQGMLGCPECYRSFEAFLGPLIERAQEGGVSHTGKSPTRLLSGAAAGAPIVPGDHVPIEPLVKPIHDQIRELQRQLEAAISAEQYEHAATLRDQIRALQAEGDQVQP
ncbi:MAG: UvrB/UvrC motif-containing protein [Planctomycetota bacterium]|nr:UvrB/UvrC motif-containing protein [Planctomycetota bacterium]